MTKIVSTIIFCRKLYKNINSGIQVSLWLWLCKFEYLSCWKASRLYKNIQLQFFFLFTDMINFKQYFGHWLECVHFPLQLTRVMWNLGTGGILFQYWCSYKRKQETCQEACVINYWDNVLSVFLYFHKEREKLNQIIWEFSNSSLNKLFLSKRIIIRHFWFIGKIS